ncbi:MAG: GIY-YIG nuclease family protein [Candidatus Saccharibacteria bacterium]
MKSSYVYIATNNTGILYIGVTSDIVKRANQHYLGQGSTFTSKYNVQHVIYVEEYTEIESAIAREKQLKGWRREKKTSLINRNNPSWQNLFMDPSAALRVTTGDEVHVGVSE